MGDECEAMVASSRMYRGGLLGGALKEMQPSQEPGRAWPPQPWCDRIPILSLYNWPPCHHLYATRQNGIATLSWDKFGIEIQSVGIQPWCDIISILCHYTTAWQHHHLYVTISWHQGQQQYMMERLIFSASKYLRWNKRYGQDTQFTFSLTVFYSGVHKENCTISGITHCTSSSISFFYFCLFFQNQRHSHGKF